MLLMIKIEISIVVYLLSNFIYLIRDIGLKLAFQTFSVFFYLLAIQLIIVPNGVIHNLTILNHTLKKSPLLAYDIALVLIIPAKLIFFFFSFSIDFRQRITDNNYLLLFSDSLLPTSSFSSSPFPTNILCFCIFFLYSY